MLQVRSSLLLFPTLAIVAATGCGGSTPTAAGPWVGSATVREAVAPSLKKPALIAFNTQGGYLQYWTINPNGGSTPHQLSAPLGIYQGYGLAADGDVVVIANYSPAEIVTYNVKTKAQSIFTDPFGKPLDVAIDKNSAIYAMNIASVTVYRPGSSQPSQLTCSYINNAQAIAVDNEGDVFVNGYGQNFMGVVEWKAGSQTCFKPHLRAELGYAGGIAINPKTDALIVVDNPNLCAGGLEGRMIIYPKPYEQRTSRRRNLNATYCTGSIRLDATSSIIFAADSTVSAGFPRIDQRSYPSAKGSAFYGDYSSGHSFAGFTTIPNTLPN
jgi:hypothetical protein